uniref:Uncharacterized protein n=1 Tax=Ascaris lumbricoides TaxID=6252 RepID=A0A0M3II73_ASCLU
MSISALKCGYSRQTRRSLHLQSSQYSFRFSSRLVFFIGLFTSAVAFISLPIAFLITLNLIYFLGSHLRLV